MAEVGFYHLLSTPLERALPRLLERALGQGHRIVLHAGSAERVEHLNALLWTYDESGFLPHGAARDGNAGLMIAERDGSYLTGYHNPCGTRGRMASIWPGPMEERYVNEYLIKPVSAIALYDRLVSITLQPRPTVQLGDYYGPEPRKLAGDAVEDVNLATSLVPPIVV